MSSLKASTRQRHPVRLVDAAFAWETAQEELTVWKEIAAKRAEGFHGASRVESKEIAYDRTRIGHIEGECNIQRNHSVQWAQCRNNGIIFGIIGLLAIPFVAALTAFVVAATTPVGTVGALWLAYAGFTGGLAALSQGMKRRHDRAVRSLEQQIDYMRSDSRIRAEQRQQVIKQLEVSGDEKFVTERLVEAKKAEQTAAEGFRELCSPTSVMRGIQAFGFKYSGCHQEMVDETYRIVDWCERQNVEHWEIAKTLTCQARSPGQPLFYPTAVRQVDFVLV